LVEVLVMRERREWAHARHEGDFYHWVTFRPGPNIHEEASACGIVARFWPRIGIRMTDRHCERCQELHDAA
jgi:hypothetical protein